MTITNLNTQNIYRLRTTQIVQNIIIKVKPKTGQNFASKNIYAASLAAWYGKTIRIFNHYHYQISNRTNMTMSHEVCESQRAKKSINKTKPINFSASHYCGWIAFTSPYSITIGDPTLGVGTQMLLSAQIRPIPVPWAMRYQKPMNNVINNYMIWMGQQSDIPIAW